MATTDKIQFVNPDADLIITGLVNRYEALTGKKLQPGQIETLEFNSVAYRISLLLNQVNETANSMLIAFATGVALEALAELVGVTRLPASAAQCTIRFDLVAGHGDLVIDKGIRIQSVDGLVVFTTLEDTSVLSTDTYTDVVCECTKTGVVGNGYVSDRINILLDPRPYITYAANIDTTAGGNDEESDEALRTRVKLAPSVFSVAGPDDAYKFWALSAHPSIVDVAVTIGHELTSPYAIIPGQVDIFPLIRNNGTLTTPIRDAVYAACNAEKVRPLTDTVVIKDPVQVDYAIEVELTIFDDAVSATELAACIAAMEAYRDERKDKLGIDAVRTQLIAAAKTSGTYSLNLVEPAADVVVGKSSFTNCTGITVTVVGTHDR